MIKTYFRAVKYRLFPRKKYELYEQNIIPAKHLRFNSSEFRDNEYYIQTAEKEARRVIERMACTENSNLLEIGCGKGRFANGLVRLIGPINYIGFDVHRPSINWCRMFIEKQNPSYHFEHLDIASERYNKDGHPIDENFTFDIEDNSIDIIYAWGVFTNMASNVMEIYLKDWNRMLKDDGKAFFTAFVEKDVPDVSVNPKGYVIEEYSGPLQVVRYEMNYIFSLISKAGIQVDDFIYGQEYDGQSEFYLSKSHSHQPN